MTGHDFVYGELLIGHRGGRKELLAPGWIDMHLLASAIVGGMSLWTADPRFDAVAAEFGVAYRAP